MHGQYAVTMSAFQRHIRSFLHRTDIWLTAASDTDALPQDDVDDILLLGENIHRHLVASVQGGDVAIAALASSIGR